MATEVKKITDLEFNELITLGVIESDADLKNIFSEDINLSFNVVRTLIQKGEVNEKIKNLLKSIFEQVILTKKDLISKYILIGKQNYVTVKVDDEVKPTETTKVEEPKKEKKKKESNLPRRYGKERILKDIEKQNGKATPLQNAMLKINDLKNMYVNLTARTIKDTFNEEKLLSDTDCRDIVSTIKIAEQKLENILKRKK